MAYGGVKSNFHAFIRFILEGREARNFALRPLYVRGVAIRTNIFEHKDHYGHFKRVGQSLLLLDIEIRLSEL